MKENIIQLYRVGPDHPWEAWHGDIVAVIEDDVPGECLFNGPSMLPEWQWLTWLVDGALECPCIWHERHARVIGSWSGVIPADGLMPLSHTK